ncbi:histone H1-delta [Galendromus occidentalis]|uniref:Histone H1-delta n=1 Tax=Galendromus occidentalis TaxID=34638 RepID=A0AAJ6VZG0_9ACAR|nr:histone H1-delta [Galendromus occidentalis]
MSDAAVAVAPKATPKKVKAVKAKPAKTSSHPSYQDMIKEAIETLKERNGSSRQAIQKYLQAHFKTCDDKVSQARLKLALKRGADNGALKRVKGAGASGSFRINVDAKKPVVKKPKAKAATAAKPKAAGVKKVKAAKPKSVKAKTAVKPKKTVAEKKATAKPKVAKKPATPKKVAKPAVKKAATPKAKKPAAKKAVAKK